MILVRSVLGACLVFAAVAAGQAEERGRCLTRNEQRTKIASHTVVPLSKAMRALKSRRKDVVRAGLCDRGGHLVYVLTLLARDGKVTRAQVDASTGKVLGGH